jgi:hypothetical protein
MTRPAGARWTCEHCGNRFERQKSGGRPIRFCDQRCYHGWRAANNVTTGQFQPGMETWNKGLKGTHFSPATEFKKGRASENWLPVGSETVRTDKNGKPRAFVKLAEPNVWRERALVVWERENGPIPEDHVIHHRDRDSLNDDPINLQAMTRPEHIEEHRRELYEAKFREAAE